MSRLARGVGQKASRPRVSKTWGQGFDSLPGRHPFVRPLKYKGNLLFLSHRALWWDTYVRGLNLAIAPSANLVRPASLVYRSTSANDLWPVIAMICKVVAPHSAK